MIMIVNQICVESKINLLENMDLMIIHLYNSVEYF